MQCRRTLPWMTSLPASSPEHRIITRGEARSRSPERITGFPACHSTPRYHRGTLGTDAVCTLSRVNERGIKVVPATRCVALTEATCASPRSWTKHGTIQTQDHYLRISSLADPDPSLSLSLSPSIDRSIGGREEKEGRGEQGSSRTRFGEAWGGDGRGPVRSV
jgi:hypothetical protein